MTLPFRFVHAAGEEISLQEAISQACHAASILHNFDETIQQHRAQQIIDALMVEILSKQKVINDRHETEISTWKQRLVDETASLREILSDRRGRIQGLLHNYWPGQYHPGDGDVVAFAKLDSGISELFALLEKEIRARVGNTPSTSPHKPE